MNTEELTPEVEESLAEVQALWPRTWKARAIVYLMQNSSISKLAFQSLSLSNELARDIANRAVSKMIQRESKKYSE